MTLSNIKITSSVSSNTLIVRLKASGGSDFSASDVGYIAIPGSSAATQRTITSAVSSLTVPQGATLGTGSGQDNKIFVYALDNAGSIEIAVSTTMQDTTGQLTRSDERRVGKAGRCRG